MVLSDEERKSIEKRLLVAKILSVSALAVFVATWVSQKCWQGDCGFYAPIGVPVLVLGIVGLGGWMFLASKLADDTGGQ